MATCTTFSSLLLLLLLTFPANFAPVTCSDPANTYLMSSQIVSRTTVEKSSHFRFYWHDITNSSNPTSVRVAQAPVTNTSTTMFGSIQMIDNPLTTGPNVKSKLVGRAQGLYASAGLKNAELLMAMNFVLTDGKYNGSTIAIFGHNEVFTSVREMPIVGGSGLFRFARGYVLAHTNSVDKDGNVVVEYNVFVNHY